MRTTPTNQGCLTPSSAPGGAFIAASPPIGSANAANQQRGGRGGVVSPSTTISIGASSVVQTLGPSPTQSGIDIACNNYAIASTGDTCIDFANAHHISPTQLYQWNPALGMDGQNCPTQFDAGTYYCIGIDSNVVTSTTTNTASVPGPTQAGIVSTCNRFASPQAGAGCSDFAIAHSITPAQLYAWNTVLGPNGENCATQLWVGEFYCIGSSN